MSEMKKKTLSLDKYDKRILHTFSFDYRYPRKKLASELKISENKLRYKIKRLENSIIIPKTIFDYAALGIPSYIILTGSLTKEEANRIKDYPGMYFLYKLMGNQYVMNILTEDIFAFCVEYLKHTEVEFFPITKYIAEDVSLYEHPLLHDSVHYLEDLNVYDYKVLYALSQEPLGPYEKLSKITGISRQTISKYTNKLVKSQYLPKIRASSGNVFGFGVDYYLLKVHFHPKHHTKLRTILKLATHTGFTYESYQTFFSQYMPEDKHDLFDFVSDITSVGKDIKIDIMELSHYYIETVPKYAIDILKRRAML